MAFRGWFPRSLSRQAIFYRNFTQVFTENAVALDFTAEDVAKLRADNAVMQFLAKTEFNIKNLKKAFQYFRGNVTKGLFENTNEFVPFDAIVSPAGRRAEYVRPPGFSGRPHRQGEKLR